MKLRLSNAALEDLRDIRDYTLQRWGEDQEELYLNSLWDRFELILVDPERYRSRADLFPGCRIAAQGKHVILFRVTEEILEVVRILHSSMDYRLHLGDQS